MRVEIVSDYLTRMLEDQGCYLQYVEELLTTPYKYIRGLARFPCHCPMEFAMHSEGFDELGLSIAIMNKITETIASGR